MPQIRFAGILWASGGTMPKPEFKPDYWEVVKGVLKDYACHKPHRLKLADPVEDTVIESDVLDEILPIVAHRLHVKSVSIGWARCVTAEELPVRLYAYREILRLSA